jgi:hypothetical protein
MKLVAAIDQSIVVNLDCADVSSQQRPSDC